MSAKPYTRATRMAATFLAKQSGADAAATAFGMDPRTVRSWMESVEIPDDQWTAIRDVLLARGAEMAALGKTAGLPAILTGAGISDRNVRYAQLIARREARREAEQPVEPEPDPIQQQISRLDPRRQRLLASEIDAELEERVDRYGRTGEPTPGAKSSIREPDALAYWAAEVDRLLAIPDDEVEQQIAALDAVLYPPATWPQPPDVPEPLPVEPTDTPEDAPTPIRRATARPAPVPMVVDSGDPDHDRGWHALERREF